MLKVWNVCLVITTFLLTMFGTFMTRSGIVQSVHAFGQDTELAVIFLVLHRLRRRSSRSATSSTACRCCARATSSTRGCRASSPSSSTTGSCSRRALFILTATLFPTLSEWVTARAHHRRAAVLHQVDDADRPGAPVPHRRRAAHRLAQGVGREPEASSSRCRRRRWCVTALVLGALTPLRGWSDVDLQARSSSSCRVALICFALCAFVITTITQEFYRGTRVRQTPHQARLLHLADRPGGARQAALRRLPRAPRDRAHVRRLRRRRLQEGERRHRSRRGRRSRSATTTLTLSRACTRSSAPEKDMVDGDRRRSPATASRSPRCIRPSGSYPPSRGRAAHHRGRHPQDARRGPVPRAQRLRRASGHRQHQGRHQPAGQLDLARLPAARSSAR